MKNKLIICLLITLSIEVSAQSYTYVPDDNFEQALIDLGYDNVLDDYVVTSNINSILTLNISNRNISDLTGIEDFTLLEDLQAKDNNYSTIDVSNNIYLTHLSANNTNITTLDVSNNTALQILFVNDNPSFTSIDISNNNLITYFDCSDTNITSLDLSNNISLFRFLCFNTALTTLDLTSNSNLGELYCSNNGNLTNLNIQNGNNINMSFFSVLNCPNLTCIQVDDSNYSNANWPNKDATASYDNDCDNLSTNDLKDDVVSIYPNPVSTLLNLETIKEIYDISIFDIEGKKIRTSSDKNIDFSNFKSGIYILKISSSIGVIYKRVIKK